MTDHPLAKITPRSRVLSSGSYRKIQHRTPSPPCAQKRDLGKVIWPTKASAKIMSNLISQLPCGMDVFSFSLRGHTDRTEVVRLEWTLVDMIQNVRNEWFMVFW